VFNDDNRMVPAVVTAMMDNNHCLFSVNGLYDGHAGSGKKYDNCDQTFHLVLLVCGLGTSGPKRTPTPRCR
jgi:hypothetical protein